MMRKLRATPGDDSSDTTPRRDAREPMQRIRVGVTGLAFVILLVTLATAIAAGVKRRLIAENATPVIAAALPSDRPASKATNDPLAQIGVTPAAETPPAQPRKTP